MASYSSEYIIDKEKLNENRTKTLESQEAALIYSTTVDLIELLLGNEPGLDRLPVIYDLEGEA